MTGQPMLADHLDRATACVESGAWPGGVFVMRDDGLRDGLRCVENGLSPVDVERALSAPLAVSYVAGNAVSSIKRLVGRPRVALPASSDLFVHRWSVLGSARAEQRIVGWSPRLGWRLASGAPWRAVDPMPGFAFAMRYRWKARLLCGKGHLVLPVDPGGALELFRARDAHGSRRAALLHWVSRHERESTLGNIHEVREHLRGARVFSWNGWECTLAESDCEAEA